MARGAVPLSDATAAGPGRRAPNRWVAATLLGARAESPRTRTLVLGTTGFAPVAAGQHVDVRLTAEDGYTAERSYSIASAAGATPIELTVDRLDDGEVSPYLVDGLEVGDSIEVRGPIGGWFVWRPQQTEPVQLIGGGSGVVPLMSMIRTHARIRATTPFRLLTSVQAPADQLFAAELEAHEGDRFAWTRHFSRQAPHGWPTAAGRVTAGDLAAETFGADLHPTVYVCGPTGFVEAVADALIALGHDATRVRTERFGPTG